MARKIGPLPHMSRWKNALLTLYYHATRPLRACTYWREVADDRLPIIVLFYHRIADDRANPWTTSNAMFVRQMQWLQNRFCFVSLSEAQERIRRGYNPQPCIAITFDDGYSENCQQAIPWLIKQRIPCTYFMTVRNVVTQEPFAHDLVMNNRFSPNSIEELKAMAAAGVEIGCHGYTHADLGPLTDPRLLHFELVKAKEDFEGLLGHPIRYFAFPFGQYANLNPAAFAMAKKAGFAGVCSAYGGLNFPGDDPFHLQRLPVDNDMIHLKNRVTQDPRLFHIKRYQYEGIEVVSPETEEEAFENTRSIVTGAGRASAKNTKKKPAKHH